MTSNRLFGSRIFSGRKKGQASVMDAFFFLMICSAAAALMIYTSGLYGANTSRQMAMVYNFEFASNTLVSLNYAVDSGGVNTFFDGLATALTGGRIGVQNYLNAEGQNIFNKLTQISPAGERTILYFEKGSDFYCLKQGASFDCLDDLPTDFEISYPNVYTATIKIEDDNTDKWKFGLQLYY